MRQVAALYVHRDSVYRSIPGVDCWDEDRDAMHYRGDDPIVAHPPCRLWAGIRGLSTADPIERLLALHAVGCLMRCGGVLVHPSRSLIWHWLRDCKDGNTWLTTVRLFDFGFPACKPTTLAIHGCHPCDWPELPIRLEPITRSLCGGRCGKKEYGRGTDNSRAPRRD